MRSRSTEETGYGGGDGGPRSMPGWNIFVDLTPPELIASRRLKVVRAIVLVAVAAVFLSCVGVYAVVRGQAKDAAEALDVADEATVALLNQQRAYSGITKLQSTIVQSQQQVADLMASDVDVDSLLGDIWDALPDGMTITAITISVPPNVGGVATGKRSGAAVLDTSDAQHVGTITLSGTGASLNDVPAYIDTLTAIPGIYDAFPVANQVDKQGASSGDLASQQQSGLTQFSLQITLTDVVLSKRFEIAGEN